MKTIEERAREFVGGIAAGNDVPDFINELLVECYCIAAIEERKLLTEWHDTKQLPAVNAQVLAKIESRNGEWEHIATAHVNNNGKFIIEGGMFEKGDKVIGWREIHE